MYSAWTKHIKDPDERDKYEKSVRHNKWVLERLAGIINEMEDDVTSIEINPKVYDISGWDYRQADLNGYRRALRQIKKLINLDQKENHDR